MNTDDSQIIDVLLVEDDPGEALLVQEALTESGTALLCHTASDGPSALRFLWRLDEFADAPRPRLVLLDLNLGAMHGLQILAKLKADEQLKTIPVVVLSSSRHPADIHHSYAHHANAYVVKPVELDELGRAISIIDACFLRLAEPSIAYQHADQPYPVPGI